MSLIRHLDKNDLIYILADYFDVKVEDVHLIPFITTEGYGMNEHDVPSIRAEVNLNKDPF